MVLRCIAALPVFACVAGTLIPGASAGREDAPEERVLTLELRFPEGAEISGEAVLWGRLWEYDPLLADASAKEVDSTEINFAKFEKGEDGVVRVSARLAAVPAGGKKYYVTVRVYPDATKDERADRFFLDGFNKVFEEGESQTLEAELKAPR